MFYTVQFNCFEARLENPKIIKRRGKGGEERGSGECEEGPNYSGVGGSDFFPKK